MDVWSIFCPPSKVYKMSSQSLNQNLNHPSGKELPKLCFTYSVQMTTAMYCKLFPPVIYAKLCACHCYKLPTESDICGTRLKPTLIVIFGGVNSPTFCLQHSLAFSWYFTNNLAKFWHDILGLNFAQVAMILCFLGKFCLPLKALKIIWAEAALLWLQKCWWYWHLKGLKLWRKQP